MTVLGFALRVAIRPGQRWFTWYVNPPEFVEHGLFWSCVLEYPASQPAIEQFWWCSQSKLSEVRAFARKETACYIETQSPFPETPHFVVNPGALCVVLPTGCR